MLQYALLWLFHLILALKRFISTLLPRRQPKPLRTRRRKLPGHLAVLLRHNESSQQKRNELQEALESVRRLALWCRIAGIRVLTVFDEEGLLLNAWERVHEVLQEGDGIVNVSVSGDVETQKASVSRTLRTPLTPPLSKSGSLSSIRSSSPESRNHQKPAREQRKDGMHPLMATFTVTNSRRDDGSKKRQPIVSSDSPASPGPLTLYIISKTSGKPHLAQITRELAKAAMREENWNHHPQTKSNTTVPVTPEVLNSLIEDPERPGGWPSPDLLLIHTPATSRRAPLSPLEFEGFPPWQMHLTEFTYIPPRIPQTTFLRQFWKLSSQYPGSIGERAFRAALDEYDGAEMRFGK